MARKQFVSSKKNAPSRAVSSKESALQERNHVAAEEDANESDTESEASNSPTSVSSQDSSGMSSGEDEDPSSVNQVESAPQPMAVEVMPSSFGRGKQLRFAGMVSRGKESRVVSADGGNASDSEESYASIVDSEEEEPQSSGDEEEANNRREQDSGYPIKGHRAKKRHHPNAEYVQRMSVYVRDCLLSVRLSAEEQEQMNNNTAAHEAFREQLRNGTVERITWQHDDTKAGDDDKSRKRQRSKKKSKDKSKSSSSSKSKKKESFASSDHENTKVKEEITPSVTKEERAAAVPITESKKPKEAALDSQKSSRASKSTESTSKEACSLCANCRKALTPTGTSVEPPKPAPSEDTTSPYVALSGKFTIDSAPRVKDIAKLRAEATKLNEEARTLKHEGNRKGGVEAGLDGQVTQAKFYLRSSGKFFQHALMLNDIKMLYKELGDVSHARNYGEYCVTTLKQTTSLIESTTRTFQSAKNIRLVALSYKFSAIMHLTIFRLQHLKLFSLFSDLFTPNRSPDSRQAVTPTPPGNGSDLNSKEHAIRQLLLKESEHFLRGCEMWRRYETCKVVVLPRVNDPLVADLSEAFFAEMEAELQK